MDGFARPGTGAHVQRQPNIIRLPAELVGQPGNLPSSCTRHGRPAVRLADFTLQSKVRIEGSRLHQVGFRGALGMAERLGQHAQKVRVTHVNGWPLCDVCARTRAVWLTVSCVMFFGGLLAFAGSLIAAILAERGTVQPLAGVAVAGLVAMILAAFPFARGGMARVIGASTAPEGGAVLVVNPSRAFVAELGRNA
ncbi:hypothetical protein [Qaidamihabitans albus]|uniref:hypothetical protein n=1 Tax=Qaidamihabitans albus TaxID=2795733 RepID=UPI0027DE5746|nr:hypothetical protein [Qaidamihabitans albus]